MPRRHFAKAWGSEHQPQPGVHLMGITQRRQFGSLFFLEPRWLAHSYA